MGKSLLYLFAFMIFSMTTMESCTDESGKQDTAERAIIDIHKDYVEGWLSMDEKKVMGLIEINARIQPNRLQPIEGKDKIRDFWFPKDSSVTIINNYETEILSLHVIDTLAITTHTSTLDWDYTKDTLAFGMIQKGINTTVYRKQKDKTWKIWRSMWTDISAK